MSILSNLFGCPCTAELNHLKRALMTKIAELSAIVTDAVAQLDKAHAEIVGKQDELLSQISALEDALSNMNDELPEDAVAALGALKAAAQSLDDVVPDAEPAPEA